ncbi:hypothetical protein KAR91_10270 [Candidatus Pacearchaeota archaeon]|nr:hypothetical protein [Candidatus Pacearchaeota archaeon]
MKIFKRLITALLLVSIISFLNNGKGAWDNLMFRLNLYDYEGEVSKVRSAIKQYNINSAQFYNTAGDDKSGLPFIPAAPLLKRRLFKDINMLSGDGLLVVFDRDRDEFIRAYFPRKDLAVAESREVWAMVLQDADTRKPRTTVKAISVKVRYIFKKEPYSNQGLTWVVYEADVYPDDEKEIPPLNIESVL